MFLGDHVQLVRELIASAIAARYIPANRLHLFDGIQAEDFGLTAALNSLAEHGGRLKGELLGQPVFKPARSVTSLIAVEVAKRLEQAVEMPQAGCVRDDAISSRIFGGLRLARALLTIDKTRNWFPQLTVERISSALRNLNRVCSRDAKVITISSGLQHDYSSWLRAKPRKGISHEQQQQPRPASHVRTARG